MTPSPTDDPLPGRGTQLALARDAGLTDLVGFEPDPVSNEIASAMGLTVLPATAEQLPVEAFAERFDVVLMSHVLEHTG